MAKNPFDLKGWADEHARYLKIAPEEAVTVQFVSAEGFIDQENDDRPKVRYTLKAGGNEKLYESQSIALAEQMGDFKAGDWLTIKRVGEGRQTRYEVSPLKSPENVLPDEIPDKKGKEMPF